MKALLLNASPKNNGNTARLLELIGDAFQKKGMETQTLCLGDLHYAFCKGCRSCYQTAECVQHDDVQLVLEQMEQADLIAIASPDYWAGSPASSRRSSTAARRTALRTSRTRRFPWASGGSASP